MSRGGTIIVVNIEMLTQDHRRQVRYQGEQDNYLPPHRSSERKELMSILRCVA